MCDQMIDAFFLCDQDGNNYGPYYSLSDAREFLHYLNDQELHAEIIEVNLPRELTSQAS